MNHIVTVEIACPLRVGFFSLNRKKKVGFSFDNLAGHLFNQSIEATSYDNVKEWLKKYGNERFFIEICWFAVESYSMHNRIKLPITKEKLMFGLGQLSKEDSKRLLQAWTTSTEFGAKQAPGKKKAVVKH